MKTRKASVVIHKEIILKDAYLTLSLILITGELLSK